MYPPKSKLRTKMEQTPSSTSNSRCNYLSGSSRRCRLPISDSGSDFCRKHIRIRQEIIASSDLTLMLTGPFQRFDSACKINDFLSDLLRLLAEKRITARDATTMAYISSLQLRTLPIIEHESTQALDVLNQRRAQDFRANAHTVFGLPRPDRSDPAPDPPKSAPETPAEATRAYERIRT